jgi:hypothetical protein
MKSLLLAAVLLVFPLSTVFGQGQVYFVNRVAGSYDNKVVRSDHGEVAGPEYKAQLALVSGSNLIPIGVPVPFRTGTANGYINGSLVTVPGIPEGGKANLAMVIFTENSAPTNVRDALNNVATATAEFTLGGSLITPPNTQFGTGFITIGVVPEPSTITLVLTAAAGMLLFCRKR